MLPNYWAGQRQQLAMGYHLDLGKQFAFSQELRQRGEVLCAFEGDQLLQDHPYKHELVLQRH